MLEFYRGEIAQLSKEYPEVRDIGLYWVQGESDKKKHADEDEKNLENLIVKRRQNISLPKLKFFIREQLFDSTNIDKIATAQKNEVKDDNNCFFLDIDLGGRKRIMRLGPSVPAIFT